MHPFMVNTLETLRICRRNAGNNLWSTVHEKWWLAATKKFRAVYGAWRFSNVMTRASNVSVFSDRCISALSSNLCPSRASSLFPGGCPTWSLRSSSPPYAPPVSSLSWSHFCCMRSADYSVRMQFFPVSCYCVTYMQVYSTLTSGILSRCSCCYVRDEVS